MSKLTDNWTSFFLSETEVRTSRQYYREDWCGKIASSDKCINDETGENREEAE